MPTVKLRTQHRSTTPPALRPASTGATARRALAASALLVQLLCLPASGAESAPAAQPAIEVNAIRDPELKPYRVMAAGLDAFDQYHALAPAARELRFKLRPRGDGSAAIMDKLALRLAGNEASMALPLSADGTFTLPRSTAFIDDDADLLLNKKRGDYRWGADIHSDNVPEGMRRLGDLRLECQVVVAIAKKELAFWMRAMVNSLLLTSDWCASDKINLPTYTPRRIAAATLLAPNGRVSLQVLDGGKGFIAPANDKRYADDTMIELDYAVD